MSLRNEKILVTGGAGFIGSNIVKELLNSGVKVRVLDNFSTGKRENISEYFKVTNFELIEGDLRSYHVVRNAVKGMKYILHQGALPSVQRSINDPITTHEVNVLGTLNILESALEFDVKRVVFASSSSIYGDSDILPKEEKMSVKPLSPYAISKYTAERYCQIYYQLNGLETVCLRYFNVFGPNHDPDSQYSAVIPKFIKTLFENRQPVIYGRGNQSRDFTYVSNIVQANILACQAKNAIGEVINIAYGKNYTLIDLVDILNKILNKNIKPLFAEERPGDVKHSLASIEKAKKLLNYKICCSFEEGLKYTINHFLKHFN